MPRSIAGKTSIDEEFWTSALWVLDEGGIRGARGYFAVCPSVPAAVSSAVRRGSKADPAGPAFGKKHQSLVIRVFLCALSAILSATSLIAPLALPTAF